MKRILNSKGMTIVEIILAIGLVSIVMVQVLNLLVDLKNEQVLGEGKTQDLSNRSIIIRQVEADFLNKRIYKVSDCTLSQNLSERSVYGLKSCVKVVFENETTKPYFLITATNNNNKKDYFIYGYAETAAATGPTIYEAWKLESGTYKGKVGDASKCPFLLLSYKCVEGGREVCDSRYFALRYPVVISEALTNTTMNFDLEFIYYYRNNVTNPSSDNNFFTNHSDTCP